MSYEIFVLFAQNNFFQKNSRNNLVMEIHFPINLHSWLSKIFSQTNGYISARYPMIARFQFHIKHKDMISEIYNQMVKISTDRK